MFRLSHSPITIPIRPKPTTRLTRDTPWRNDLDVWLKAVECKLETDLVVTLASAAVGDELAALPLSSLDHTASNDRAGQ